MKAFIYFFVVFLNCEVLFAQSDLSITGLNLSQNSASQIKANVKVMGATVGEYFSYNTQINQNQITLSVCYHMTDFGGITHFENDFNIDLPSVPSNYNFKLNVYRTNDPLTCDYQDLQDTASLNFSTPIQGVVSLGTNDNTNVGQDLKLFPIPSKDALHIHTDSKVENVSVYDISGKKIPSTVENNRIDTSKLKSGTYFLEIYIDNKKFYRKFTVEK